jgi:hypothetical protein
MVIAGALWGSGMRWASIATATTTTASNTPTRTRRELLRTGTALRQVRVAVDGVMCAP